jgi:hypothetical protein
MRRLLSLFVGLFFICCAAGCSRDPSDAVPLAAADGTVTFRGSPLAGATVTFFPEKGPLAQAVTGLDGKFTFKTDTRAGVAIGPVKVSVSADQAVNSAAADGFSKAPQTPAEQQEYMKKAGEMAQARKKAPSSETAPVSVIPARYNKPQSSGLSYTIKADGDNHFQIELKQ